MARLALIMLCQLQLRAQTRLSAFLVFLERLDKVVVHYIGAINGNLLGLTLYFLHCRCEKNRSVLYLILLVKNKSTRIKAPRDKRLIGLGLEEEFPESHKFSG